MLILKILNVFLWLKFSPSLNLKKFSSFRSGTKYTKARRSVKLVAVSREMTKSDALKLEYSVKKLLGNRKINECMKGGQS